MAHIYVASSWRNKRQESIVALLRHSGHDVYDFKHEGFHWREVLPGWDHDKGTVDVDAYRKGLTRPRAQDGFYRDLNAMAQADTCVLVLPCGRSAHLELGWFVGRPGKRSAVLLDGPEVTPELMYLLVDCIAKNEQELLEWLHR